MKKNNYLNRNTILLIVVLIIIYLYITYQHELFNLTESYTYEGLNDDSKKGSSTSTSTKETIQLNTNNPKDIQKYVQDVISNYINANIKVKGPKGPKGPRGRQGKQGRTGGTFLESGFIRNVSMPNDKNNISMVLDRTYGKGKGTRLFLNERNNLSNQMWKLNSNNTLSNQYGLCVTAQNDKDVYMAKCKPQKKKFQWSFTKDGQILYNKTGKDCLSLSSIKADDNFTLNGKDGQWSTESSLKDKKVVTLEKCDLSKLDQRWTFN